MLKTTEQKINEALLRKVESLEERIKALESLNVEYRKILKEHNVYLVHLRKANRKATRPST